MLKNTITFNYLYSMNHLPEILVFFTVFELHNVRMIKKLMTLLIISDFSV